MLESPAYPQARQQAQAAADAGDLDGARVLLEIAVDAGRPRLADGDPELLETMRRLAGLHLRADDPMAARRLLEEALAAGHRMGDTDPLAVMLAHDLGATAEQLANRHEARTQFARVAEFGPAALGEDHWAVTRARSYLSSGESVPSASAVTAPVFTAASFAEPPPLPPPAGPPVAVPPLPGPPVAVPPLPGPAVAVPPLPGPAVAVPPLPGPAFAVPPLPGPVASPAAESPSGEPWSASVDPAWSVSGASWPAAAPPVEGGTAAGGRVWLPWVLSGLAVVVVLVVIAVVLRPVLSDTPAALTATSAPGAAATLPASRGLGAAPAPSSVAASVSAPASKAASASPTPTPASPKPSRTSAAATVRTRIASPANGSTVPWPFDAKFTVSTADVAATSTVVALSVCVAGLCYLDGKLDIISGQAAPYTIHLGSTKPEGTGVAWQVRLDRLAESSYDKLVKDRNAAIADGSWGDTASTPKSALNSTPLSTVTVTKQP
ncbi:tetratricopeptide repeat protein [Paractinoplanes durhamensis]|uniref:Tetratricopeptide repeat protein n=1 Tax=Paractinoplanes durhamensis TaxID=113563 RepID=A0ABQ3YZW5_9ACTN|nr:tetratricopeptide repeat protein [Actinoplanes durhamensis]GIE03125.1 hypothetical protein Adu01nite_44750 [Actinoplanes durhamensis]